MFCFFFKQKTAYEMRISDWSSDVCSSDLTIDTEQFVNLPGAVKGALAASMADKSRNLSLYAEDSLFVTPGLALIAGVQYLHASRNRHDRFLLAGKQSSQRNNDLWR